MSMKLIETVTLSSPTLNIVFSSIPQTGTDLLVHLSARSARATVTDDVMMVINSDTTSGRYTMRQVLGSGAGVASTSNTTYWGMYLGEISAANSTANVFGSVTAYIANYAGSTAKHAMADAVSENNATEAYQHLQALLYNQTTAITALRLTSMNGQNFVAGTTASLYTITKGSDGITTNI